MSRRTKLCITALFLVLLAIPIGYAVTTWSVPGEALSFCYTGTRLVPATIKGPASMERISETLVAIDFEVENPHAIGIHLWEVHLLPRNTSVSGPVDPTKLIFTMAGAPSTYLGRLHPQTSGTEPHVDFPFYEPPPVPAQGVRRYSVVMSSNVASLFDPAKAHVVYSWRTATQHRVDKCIRWCRSFLPEKYRHHLKTPGYTMDITPITISPFASATTTTP